MAGSSSSSGGPSVNFTVYNPGSAPGQGARNAVVINGFVGNITDTVQHDFVLAQNNLSGQPCRSYITYITVTNKSGTNAMITMTDGVSTLYLQAPANSGSNHPLGNLVPFISAVGAKITVQSDVAANIFLSCLGYQGP